MHRILESCPTCGGELEIRELECATCHTEIRGHYQSNPFSRLNDEQVRFLELFVQARGNMRVLEQTLGVSYPTVRNRIEAIGAILASGRADAAVTVSVPVEGGENAGANGAADTAAPRARGGRGGAGRGGRKRTNAGA